MTFDFDHPPERLGTDSQKWQKYAGRDIAAAVGRRHGFQVPRPRSSRRCSERVEHGIFGYARPVKSTIDAVVAALASRYGWKIDPAWLVWLPGLVVRAQRHRPRLRRSRRRSPDAHAGLSAVHERAEKLRRAFRCRCRACCSRRRAGRSIGTRSKRAVTPRTKMFLSLQSAQSPRPRLAPRRTGAPRGILRAAQSRALLRRDPLRPDPRSGVAATFPPPRFRRKSPRERSRSWRRARPTMSRASARRSPSSPIRRLRAQFVRATAGIVAEVNVLGFAACEAAYRDSEDWRQALLAYLRGNRDFLLDFVARELPGVKDRGADRGDLSRLAECRRRSSSPIPIAHFEKHGVGLSDGASCSARRAASYVRI